MSANKDLVEGPPLDSAREVDSEPEVVPEVPTWPCPGATGGPPATTNGSPATTNGTPATTNGTPAVTIPAPPPADIPS